MSTLRIFSLFLLVAGFGPMDILAQVWLPDKVVTSTKSLDAIANELKSAGLGSKVKIQFEEYANVGSFRPDDSVLKRIDTLIFERSPRSQGIEFVNVKNTLMDIKGHTGTLILKGLAFKMDSPGAILLSGYDFNRVNHHLVIDSCFIFGDMVSSAFLSWYGDSTSSVQIKRSFLVFKQGVTPASHKLLFNASTYSFLNNLFNFPGSVNAQVLSGGDFSMHSNSVNRTQFNLVSTAFEKATYNFNLNYIGHPPPVDAFDGSNQPCFLKATGFDILNSMVKNNILYKSWTNFDHRANGMYWFDSVITNVRRETTQGITAGEFWNWYAPAQDDSRGMGSGAGARSPRYNVFPSTTDTSLGTRFNLNALDVVLKPAPFPRHFGLTYVPVAVPDTLRPDLRILSPENGAMRFGPFQVSSLRLSTENGKLGKPVLIAVDTVGRLVPQKAGVDSIPFLFSNELPTARSFYFSFQGNTRRGVSIRPDLPANELSVDDSLVFSKVDSAGQTNVFVPSTEYPEFYRTLGRSFRITTTASTSGTMVFGTRIKDKDVIPWDSTQVYWWRPKSPTLDSAIRSSNGKFLLTMPADTAVKEGYLIEKLNVRKKGSTTFPLGRGGKVHVYSENGFQLRIDSNTFTPNPELYGFPSPAYALRFPGRNPITDTVSLFLPAGPDMGVFKTKSPKNDTVIPVSGITPQDTGSFKLYVAPGDSGVHFFSAIPYNVMAGKTFSATLKGLEVDDLLSSTPGLFQPGILDPMIRTRSTTGGDTLPAADASLLGGAAFRTLNLAPHPADSTGFSVRFDFRAPDDPTQMQAFAWEKANTRWRRVELVAGTDSLGPQCSGLRIGDSAVIVLETLKPPMDYIDSNRAANSEAITVTTRYRMSAVHGSYKQFIVEVRSVDTSGIVSTDWTVGPKPIGDTIIVPLSGFSGMVSYRVRFYDATGPTTANVEYENLDPLWKPANLQPDTADKERYRWHLVGFPYNAKRSASLSPKDSVEQGVKDNPRYLLLSGSGGKSEWDTGTAAAKPDYSFQAGDGLLFAMPATYTFKVDSLATFMLPQPHTIHNSGKEGWRFVAVPFPMAFAVTKVTSNIGGAAVPFFRFNYTPKPGVSVGKDWYSWPELSNTDKLQPFKAYAYYFRKNEILTFDPWYIPAALSPKSSAVPTLSSVDLTLTAGGIPRSMRIVAGKDARDVPFLSGLAGGLEMRVGGNGGYAWKRLDDLSAIDLPVIFNAPQPSAARLSFKRTGTPAASGWRALLIDLATGAVVDPAAQNLVLPAGTSEYRLVAGSESFVQERVSRFQAGLPADLVLSQNAPNPFRGVTRIALDWPALTSAALSSGADRRAHLEVFNARGKRMQRLDLGRALAGRQWITVDATRWEAGFYTYRLTVITGAGKSRLQKRMLVIR